MMAFLPPIEPLDRAGFESVVDPDRKKQTSPAIRMYRNI